MTKIKMEITPVKTCSYKRPYDITILLVALFMLFPIWILLAVAIPIAIWLGDRGPVFYQQKRAGTNGKAFTILKFRTMIPDAQLAGPAWTTKDDPRITTVGRVLRRTALDELPELLSILKGDMSFVGPRALNREEQAILERDIPGFRMRLSVIPGLTGLAQVFNKSDDDQDKLRYDLEYIERMNCVLDLKLLVLSVVNTLLGKWDNRSGKN